MKRDRPKSPPAANGGEAWLPAGHIDDMLELMEQRGLEELEIERGGLRIRIRRGLAGGATVAPSSGRAAAAAPAAEPAAAPAEAEDLHIIKSPIVGTFYASSAPGAPPFVKVGDQVEAGQVLCIIEAMKLMNEIKAEIAGEVVRIHAVNAQPVEYGAPLFALRPSPQP